MEKKEKGQSERGHALTPHAFGIGETGHGRHVTRCGTPGTVRRIDFATRRVHWTACNAFCTILQPKIHLNIAHSAASRTHYFPRNWTCVKETAGREHSPYSLPLPLVTLVSIAAQKYTSFSELFYLTSQVHIRIPLLS
jgi:hypothetical protein